MRLTRKRACNIWAQRGFMTSLPRSFHTKEVINEKITPDGITPREYAHVMAKWETMPGYTCWHDAFMRIAKGDDGISDSEIVEQYNRLKERIIK